MGVVFVFRSDRSVRVQFMDNGKQTWYPAALMTVIRDADGNAVEQDDLSDMPDFLVDDTDGTRVPLDVSIPYLHDTQFPLLLRRLVHS